MREIMLHQFNLCRNSPQSSSSLSQFPLPLQDTTVVTQTFAGNWIIAKMPLSNWITLPCYFHRHNRSAARYCCQTLSNFSCCSFIDGNHHGGHGGSDFQPGGHNGGGSDWNKQGTCPRGNFNTRDDYSNGCRSDRDCPGKDKCCSNRFGGFSCKYPNFY